MEGRLLLPSCPASPENFEAVILGTIGPGFGDEEAEGGTRSENMALFEGGEKAVGGEVESWVDEGAKESPNEA